MLLPKPQPGQYAQPSEWKGQIVAESIKSVLANANRIKAVIHIIASRFRQNKENNFLIMR
jgi:hypothetical protein